MKNEDLPILKYLKWNKKLLEHPEFIKAKKSVIKQKTDNYKSFLNKSYPFLTPKKGPDDIMSLSKILDAITGISRIWPWFAEAASSKVEAISQTFATAMQNSYDAFLKAELFAELENQDLQGTLILPDKKVICYDFIIFSPQEGQNGPTYTLKGNIICLEEGEHLLYDFFEDVYIDGELEGTQSWHDFDTYEHMSQKEKKFNEEGPIKGSIGEIMKNNGIEFKVSEETSPNVMKMSDLILIFHLFKKYAPIELIVSEKERKERNVTKIESRSKIDYLDCSWYTTIVRTEGFSVRGHFRLQPCGPNRQDKKLIYIHEYQKHGYVKRARLIINQETDKQ